MGQALQEKLAETVKFSSASSAQHSPTSPPEPLAAPCEHPSQPAQSQAPWCRTLYITAPAHAAMINSRTIIDPALIVYACTFSPTLTAALCVLGLDAGRTSINTTNAITANATTVQKLNATWPVIKPPTLYTISAKQYA